MKQSNGLQTRTSLQSRPKKYSAIQNYFKKINSIINSTQPKPIQTNSQHQSHSNYLIPTAQINLTNHQQLSDSQPNIKSKFNKRSLSMKSELQPQPQNYVKNPKSKTHHNTKFNLTHVKIKQDLSLQSAKTNFKVRTTTKNADDKAFTQTKHSFSKRKIFTEPSQTFCGNLRLINQFQGTFYKSQGQQELTSEKIQQSKKNILQKISLYVRDLDQKGEEQLNQMLINEYRQKIRFHSDAYRYESTIKQMINTNKKIVSLLREQLLSQRNLFNFSIKDDLKSFQKDLALQSSPSNSKFLIVDNFQTDIQEIKNNVTIKNLSLKDNQFNQTQSESKLKLNELQSQILQKNTKNQHEYENQVHHVTKQFVSEWTKSQKHKKAVYQKFRATIFQKFPQIRKRERKIKGEAQGLSNFSSSSEDNWLTTTKQIKIKIQPQVKTIKETILNATNNLKNQQGNKNLKGSPLKNKNTEISVLDSSINENRPSASRIHRLSKKSSISKASTLTLDILASQSKQQVAKINFQNLIQFIFKRAFFYSKSLNKVIQNKAPYQEIQYTPRVEKKDSRISFMLYNSSYEEKRSLRMEKLNQKKLRATGNFLIKNKFKIMSLQKEGRKSFDFLRRCLEDAVQDYLKGSKTK